MARSHNYITYLSQRPFCGTFVALDGIAILGAGYATIIMCGEGHTRASVGFLVNLDRNLCTFFGQTRASVGFNRNLGKFRSESVYI
jgi:hypothetical protein